MELWQRKLKTTALFWQNIGVEMAKERRCFSALTVVFLERDSAKNKRACLALAALSFLAMADIMQAWSVHLA
ncbi:MAG: hypothetical protein IJR87_02210 [Bacteroidaceae bacterium]|nr:hypothetical protein [Bacteroidaceae bacterium]